MIPYKVVWKEIDYLFDIVRSNWEKVNFISKSF